MRHARAVLPGGGRLDRVEWERRHRVILAVLVLHIPALLLLGLRASHAEGHAALLVVPLAVAVAVAAGPRLGRRLRAAVTTIGLMGTSAILVYLLEGLTEAHFHFFVMLFVIVLYQDWLTFLLAAVFVLVEHAVVGVLAPHVVYSHDDAQHSPIIWAGVHALFITGAAVAAVANWRMTETAQQESRLARQQLTDQADRDQLTGVLNRHGFEREVAAALVAVHRAPSVW
jgi:hypothetical protein